MAHDFTVQFPTLFEKAQELHNYLTGVAMVLLFAGLITTAWRSATQGDLVGSVRMVLTCCLLAVVIQLFPQWVTSIGQLTSAFIDEVSANPAETHSEFAVLITGRDEGDDVGLWDVLWAEEGGLGEAVIYAITLLMGKIAWLIVWLAYVIQHITAAFAYHFHLYSSVSLHSTRPEVWPLISCCPYLAFSFGHSDGPLPICSPKP